MTTPGTYRPSLTDGRRFGIDISRNQGRVDFNELVSVLPRVEYIACRTGISWGYKDSMFAIYWAELKKRNIPRMAYHVLYPAESAAAQADNFLSMFPDRKYDGEGPIVNDLELVHGVSKSALSNAAENFSKALEDRTGREVIVYSRFTFVRDFMAKQAWMAQRKWWMAQYLATDPPSEFLGKPWIPDGYHDLDVWIVQTGERGDGPYYGTESKQLDTNRWLKSEAAFRAMFGTIQPAPVPVPVPVPTPTPTPAPTGYRYRVITDWLNVRRMPTAGGNTPIRQLRKGDVVNLVEVAGGDVWIEIAPGEFCALQIGSTKYLERVK
ncbi:hypothetical protein SY88_23740 [Clostridiales bacterium PH28_bin88]|nr:hypothetical protein SY88_23740 [Clostridiales bacterium PH28_bin88]